MSESGFDRPTDFSLAPGSSCAAWIYKCAGCHREKILRETIIDGVRIRKASLEMGLREFDGWAKRRGKWFCSGCSSKEAQG